MPCVYFLASTSEPKTVRYVGVTKASTPDKRLKEHYAGAASTSRLPLYAWMRHHLVEGHMIFVHHYEVVATRQEALELEIESIAALRASGEKLMNATDGGDGGRGNRHTAEARAKISAGLRGHAVSEATRQKIGESVKNGPNATKRSAKISAARRGRPVSEEQRQQISKTLTGRKTPPEVIEKRRQSQMGHAVSEETRRKISESNMGKVMSEESRKKMSESQRRRFARARGEL